MTISSYSRDLKINFVPSSLKIATSAILSAVGVVLSALNPFANIVIFGAKINPFAHFINVIAGILLGPFYASITALTIAIMRFLFGWGTILAFPGGISGAILVGCIRELIIRKDHRKIMYAGFFEPLGTIFIGGTISSFLISTPVFTLWGLFALSCIPGSILGIITIILLQKEHLHDRYLENQISIQNVKDTKGS